jgi:enoyl-CoA hydratase/carnithine racemase
MPELIKITQQERVLIAVLDNPPHALLTDPMVEELSALIDRADRDHTVGAVILTGAHPDAFISHYDVGELLKMARGAPPLNSHAATISVNVVANLEGVPGASRMLKQTPVGGLINLRGFHDVLSRIGRSGATFIAAINGDTAGGGLELSMASDLRFIASHCRLAQPEMLLGFPPGGGGTQRLPRLIGPGRALDLILTGREVFTDEALAIGLVSRVFPREELLARTLAEAKRLSLRSKSVVAATKRAILEGSSLALEDGLRMEQASFVYALGTPQARRAMKAYVAATKERGLLPAQDPTTVEQLQNGTFTDLVND